MVGVAEGVDRNIPRFVPRKLFLVVQDTHKFNDRQGGVGVVKLDDVFLSELVEGGVGLPVSSNDIAHGTGGEEVFLNQTQLLSGIGVIGWIQYLGHVFRPVLFLDGTDIVSLVEDVKAEAFVEAAESKGASLIGMSALLTTTMPGMQEVTALLAEKNLKGKIRTVVGGAPVSEDFAREIGADAYAPDARHAVEVVKSLCATR